MAKVKMKSVEIVAPVETAKDLFDYLQMKSVVEIRQLEDIEGIDRFETSQMVMRIDKYRDTAGTALEILDKYVPAKSSLLDALKGLPVMTEKEYLDRSDMADEYLGVCLKICNAEKSIVENKSYITRCRAAADAVKPWLPLDVPMQFKGTENCRAVVGTLPGDYTADSLRIALAAYLEGEERYECEIVSRSADRSCLFALAHNEAYDAVLSALRSLGFAYVSDPTKHPPQVRFDRMNREIESAQAQIDDDIARIKELSPERENIKYAYDWFTVRRDKYEALDKASVGDSFVAFGGYVPAQAADTLASEIEERFCAAVEISEPADEDDAPVLLRNRPFTAAVEPITEMYAMPGREDIDPNPVMSIFYYVFFGLMLSDAGYGLLMAIGCGIAKFGFKVKGRLRKTVDMYFWCGLATVFWGVLFGSFFGDIIPRISAEFFDKTLVVPWAADTPGSIALWFEPVNDPMKLLCYSFLFGIIHLFFGLGCAFVKMWKQGNKTGAVFDCVPVFLLILGIVPIGAGILNVTVPAILTTIGKYLAIAGSVLIVLTAGRSSKNIAGKLGIGLYGLYNTASGWLSDILSYSRLLALGLCTGVIATVVNTLGCIPSN
ncbi:MAG: V-type ATP synthase subunit I, partial [Clostridia bacterium]|nr:V-type ATP synthase subunit I [Clostridia bacterium]